MKRSAIIQKPLAVVALLLLLFSAAPKKFLHDLIADHQDFYAALPGDEPGVSNTGFDCHIHDLVVSAPFVITSLPAQATPNAAHTVKKESSYRFYFDLTFSTKDSRGPPAQG